MRPPRKGSWGGGCCLKRGEAATALRPSGCGHLVASGRGLLAPRHMPEV
jgi:hypothetical protein